MTANDWRRSPKGSCHSFRVRSGISASRTFRILRGPPIASRCALQFRAGKIKPSDFIHPRGEPKKALGTENPA